MALTCWLPLLGTTENQGCRNITTTNNGAVIDNNGKIGKCYSFNGNNYYIALTGQELFDCFKGGAIAFSICMWVYHADTRRAILFGDYGLSNSIGFNIELSTGHGLRFYWNGSPDYSPGLNVGLNTWSHVALTYDGTSLKSYLNGNLVATRSGTLATRSKTAGEFRLGRDNRTTDTALNGKLNDIRVYGDHCLSAAEVKEISQGLVLHYKLDGFQGGLGNPNLYTGSRDFSGTWVNGNNWTVASETYQGFTVKQRSATWGGLCQNVTCAQNDIFTVSFYAKVDSGGQIMSIHRSSLGNVTTGLSILGGNFSSGTNWIITNQDGTQWKRYWATVQITSADITYLQWRIENNQNGKNLYVCGMKLEKGSSHTGWSPAASEGSFNTIQDSSGYGHNGTIINTLSLVTSQARYSSNIHFSANNQHIQLPAITYSNFGNSFTIAWWGKRSTHSNMMFWGFSDGNRLNGLYNGTLWNTGDGSNNPIYKPGTTTTITAPTATSWHHYVMVGNGTKSQLYVDGILYGEAKTYKGLTGTSIWINGWRNHTEYSSTDMDISDFRIYATALSADDILSLYHTSAKVDNKQNLHTFELIENNSAIKINKCGQTLCNELEEDTATKFYKTNQIIETNEIIEF